MYPVFILKSSYPLVYKQPITGFIARELFIQIDHITFWGNHLHGHFDKIRLITKSEIILWQKTTQKLHNLQVIIYILRKTECVWIEFAN